MAAQVKVRECGLCLLWPTLSTDPVCDDSAAEGKYANAVLYK